MEFPHAWFYFFNLQNVETLLDNIAQLPNCKILILQYILRERETERERQRECVCVFVYVCVCVCVFVF